MRDYSREVKVHLVAHMSLPAIRGGVGSIRREAQQIGPEQLETHLAAKIHSTTCQFRAG
jgi:hypothetical protein